MMRPPLLLILWTCAVFAGVSAGAVTAHAQNTREALQNREWRLTRLGNSSLPSTDTVSITLQFGDTTYTVQGACNRSTGRYWTRGISRIGFEPAAGTWRSCPHLNMDAQMTEMLRRVNRYRVHTSGSGVRSLSLRRGLRVVAILEAAR